MPNGRLYSLNESARTLDVDRNLVAFLVNERQIPYSIGGPSAGRGQGRAKFLDAEGLERLRLAIADYHRKAEPAISA